MNKWKEHFKMWFLGLLLVAFVAGCASNAQEISKTADTTAPTVSFTSPTNGATDVAINRKVNVAFSEAMNSTTITTATFTLKQGTTSVSGTVAYVGTSATFTPASNLTASTEYTATITTGVKDTAGNAMASNFVFTFTTGAAADATAPTVSVTSPTNAAVSVPVNRKVTIGFSEVMDPATITTATFTVKETVSGSSVSGTVTPVGTSATFTPASNLAASTVYTATITTGVKDTAGNAMASNFVFTFTTGAAADATAPTVSVTSPTNAAVSVPVNRKVTIGFSEVMDPATITTATFTVKETVSGSSVSGTVTPVGTSATFTPASNLAASTVYTATITTGVKDTAGNAMASNFVFTFTTGAAADSIAPTVSVTSPTDAAVAVPVNRKVTVGFSEVMDPLTVTTLTFTVKETVSGSSVSGTVTPVGTSAIFTPASNLAASTGYTVTITTGVKDTAGNAMASNFVFTFTTGAAADSIAPTVSFTSPANGSIAVALNRKVNVAFSEVMDPLTITTATFKLTGPGLTPVTGIVSYIGTTATFTPLSNLAANTLFTGTITTGAKDTAGNAMATEYVWTFTTGVAPDTTAPLVISTIPLDLATGVATNSAVTAIFSEAMDPLTITTSTITLAETVSGNIVPGTVIYDDGSKTMTFTPLSNLAFSTNYTATIKGGIGGVTDLAGNAMATDYLWTFTTGAAPDTTAPTVTLTVPIDLATGVELNSAVNATFSEDMDPLTISTATFTLMNGVTPVTGIVAYDVLSKVATFTPSSNLDSSTTYTATITGAADLAGNALVSGLVPNPWTFTTGSTGLAPGAVDLGSAGTFGIMATSAITNTGFSTINGDVSLDPGTSMTGFPPGVVNGTIHINDTVSAQARIDLLTAYNYATTLPPGTTVSGGADLGALYPSGIPPGTYTSGSTMLVSTPLVLDAGGNANAVWVFQIGSSLTTGANVSLANGAQAKNVFWVPVLDATIGVGTIFHGTIVSGRDVSGVTGATINGRILAGATTAGTIALDTNTVNVPAP